MSIPSALQFSAMNGTRGHRAGKGDEDDATAAIRTQAAGSAIRRPRQAVPRMRSAMGSSSQRSAGLRRIMIRILVVHANPHIPFAG